ncbi:MAG: HAD family hydrolase [Candidatus Woesearchaeota archaeon]
MIKALIFDMDGTLVDTGKIGFDVLETWLKEKKLNYKEAHVKEIAFRSFSEILQEIVEENNKKYLPEMREDLIKRYKIKIKNAKALPYAVEVLENLHDKFIMIIATLSLKEIASRILKENDLEKYFDMIVCMDTKKIKDKKEMLSNILKETKLKPKECILIEDSHHGIKSGINNEIFTIGVKHYFADIEADVEVNNLKQAEKVILEKWKL